MFFATVASCLLGIAGCSSGKSPHAGPHVFQGRGSLPLSGDLGRLGRAFRDGFDEGLRSVPDTTFAWRWVWSDNGGAPDSLQAWVDALSSGTPNLDLALGGLGGVASGVALDSVATPLLWMGDGTPVAGSSLWPVWPDQDQLLHALGSWYLAQDTPAVALVLADGAWTGTFLDHEDLFPGLTALPHDPGTRRWDREMGQILSMRPRTIVAWNRPDDAASFVTRPLITSFLSRTTMLLPEGVPAPVGARVFRLRPMWLPSVPADSLQASVLRAWGFQVGAGVASASHQAQRNPTMPWFVALRSAACDTARIDLPAGGWVPRLRVERDST